METIAAASEPDTYFRLPPDTLLRIINPTPLVEDKDQDKASDSNRQIRCRQCFQVITHSSERTGVQGSFHHTFANPHGILFEIGCFKTAGGCTYTGPAIAEWSWFAGYRWKVALCSLCLIHLGWLFTSTNGHSFHGLILDRLTDAP